MTDAVPTAGKYARILRNSAYLRVFSAGLGSTAGQGIAGVCLVWIIYVDTGSALDVGLLGASYLVTAIVFSVFTGAWVDRYDRRRLMILSDFARALAMGVVVVDLEIRGFDLLTILVAYAVVGAFSTLFNPAEQALVPALVGEGEVADANGLVRSSRSALQFVGTSVAGLLIVSVGGNAGVAANAATFLLSGMLLLGMRVPVAGARLVRPRPSGSSYFHDIGDGFRWLWRAQGFFQLTISATFFNFSSNLISTFLVIFATVVLHGSALVYAFLLAAAVAGQGLGSLLVGPTHGERWAGRAWVVPYGIGAAGCTILMVLFPSVPVAISALFAVGLLAGYSGTAWLTAAQLLVPTGMQGRYFGIDNLGSIAILPVSQIGGAFLIEAYGVHSTYLAVGVFWLLSGLVFLAPRALWNLGVRPKDPRLTSRSGDGALGTPGSPEGTRGE
jgi:MFS transporter, DHA3 family, macrolide efflux protein